MRVYYRIQPRTRMVIDTRYYFGRVHVSQSIDLDFHCVTFGIKPYFLCSCGKIVSTLFLRPDQPSAFRCRICLNLRYALNGINRHSAHGDTFYRTYWHMKMAKLEGTIKRRFYSNLMTRRFRSLCKGRWKWLTNEQEKMKLEERHKLATV
jgi:hypothetical protein